MKAFLVGLLFIIFAGIGVYIGLKYFYRPKTATQIYKTAAVTKTGELRKTNVAGSDFTHVLVATGQSLGVASYTLNLDDYIGKQVEVTGQFSGTTLYADSINILE